MFVKVIENDHQLSNEFTDILEQWVQTPGRTQQPLAVVSYQLPPEGQRQRGNRRPPPHTWRVYRQTCAEGHPNPPEEDGDPLLQGRERQHVSC